MRIRLSDEDRKTLGLDHEWVSFTADKLMMLEAEALETAGYEVDEFLEDLRGHPVYRKGQPVMDEGPDGQRTQRTKVPMRTMRAVTWLAVRRSGLQIPFAEFDYNGSEATYVADEDEQGKDPATEA